MKDYFGIELDQPSLVSNNQKVCHKKVAEVAKEMAATFYEMMYTNPKVAKMIQDNGGHRMPLKKFVRLKWGQFIPYARSTLLFLLTDERSHLSEEDKETIYDIFVKEGVFRQAMARGTGDYA